MHVCLGAQLSWACEVCAGGGEEESMNVGIQLGRGRALPREDLGLDLVPLSLFGSLGPSSLSPVGLSFLNYKTKIILTLVLIVLKMCL